MAPHHAAKARLRIVDAGDADGQSEAPAFIGPDYARIRARDWGRLHASADKREPIWLPSTGGGNWRGDDKRRFER